VAEANRAMHWAGAARWDQTLAVALVGALIGGGLYLGNRAYVEAGIPTPCGAGCVTLGSAPLSSDQEMLEVESAIANGNATSGGPYVSVALLDPFTYSTSGTISQARIIDELRGAATAQQVANSQGDIKIHLLLANEGTSGEEGEAQAVQQIQQLEVPDHIVAVAGMGLSTANTQTAAAALSADGIPMFGAVTTGDEFDSNNYQGFYQIVPNVATQVKQWWTKLQTTLQPSPPPKNLQRGAKPPPPYVALVSSDQKSDIYSSDLHIDFNGAFGGLPGLHDNSFTFDPATDSQQFADIATQICNQPNGAATWTVLYAGREAVLPIFIQAFQQSTRCDSRSITIITGSDADDLPVSATATGSAKVTVEYTDIENVSSLSSNTFATKRSQSTLSPGVTGTACWNESGNPDPWTVATYDSVLAAADATWNAAKAEQKAHNASGVPTKTEVLSWAMQTQEQGVPDAYKALPGPGASQALPGPFGFNHSGELSPTDIPIYKVTNEQCSQPYKRLGARG
jgi:hypothetical protein